MVSPETASVATEENKPKSIPADTTSENSQEVDTNPRLTGLALMLDDGTRKSHSVAENTAFVTGFFKGISKRESYRKLVTSLYFVYTAMESAFDGTDDPNVRALDDPELRRVDALHKDMDYFYGPSWREGGLIAVEPSPATKTYVARIKEISEKQPHLLIAHQYTRYLGDLFGGQMMGGMATRSLKLDEGKGVAFYNFDDIPSTKDFIAGWYRRLNGLNLTDQEKMEIVDEANFVFDLNIGVLQELEGSPFAAMWTLAMNSLRLKLGLA